VKKMPPMFRMCDHAIKTLETDRLLLRSWNRDDPSELFEFANLDAGSDACWESDSNDEVALKVQKKFKENKESWAIVLKDNSKIIGAIGLHPYVRYGVPKAEQLSFALSPEHWGRGFATEAVRRVTEYVFDERKPDILCIIFEDEFRGRSRIPGVANRCGFSRDGSMRYSRIRHGIFVDEDLYITTGKGYAKKIKLKTLESERLILRRGRYDDIEDLYRFANDPRKNYKSGWEFSAEKDKSIREFKNQIDREILWTIVLKENGKVIGAIEEYTDWWKHGHEIGYIISPDEWNKGYATEATKRVIKYLFEETHVEKLNAEHYTENIGSGRTLEKCGFKKEDGLFQRRMPSGEIVDTFRYTLTRPKIFCSEVHSWSDRSAGHITVE
jgi:RimJ/RimL family protein N-acetyltransferase